jgi:hypothetical protein
MQGYRCDHCHRFMDSVTFEILDGRPLHLNKYHFDSRECMRAWVAKH